MHTMLGRNILRLRKEKCYTQDDLAKKLNVSFQLISKWETGQSYPDASILPELAYILGTDLNTLMGYVHNRRMVTIYEDQYKQDGYYWGIEPSKLCYLILEKLPPIKPLKLLDVGCGEGKDAVFFAKNGYEVTAFDVAEAGVEKTKRLASRHRVNVRAFKANIADFRLDTKFDVVYSSGVFQYIPPKLREEIIENYQLNTNAGGIHAINAFIEKPFIAPPPEKEPAFFPWCSGELFLPYTGWKIRKCREYIFDCTSSGVAHEHCMNEILAEKML